MSNAYEVATAAAEQAKTATSSAIINKSRFKKGEGSIALPFGVRISDKPYKRMRFKNRGEWWLGEPEKLILPEILETVGSKYRLEDGRYCLGWPNSTEEGTTMYLADAHGGFEPVLWKHINKTLGARVKTHEGTKAREGEGFVYYRRHIFVWVHPELWHQEHVQPILNSLSLLATSGEEWASIVEETSRRTVGDVIAVGQSERESEEVLVPK